MVSHLFSKKHRNGLALQWSLSSNAFGSNDHFEALPHLQSNDTKFRSNSNYSGHPGLNFKHKKIEKLQKARRPALGSSC